MGISISALYFVGRNFFVPLETQGASPFLSTEK